MLRGTFAFLTLVACAVVVAELRSAFARRGWRAPAAEGVSFLAVGVALGGHGLGLFPDDLLAGFRVVVLFGLAWIGLVFGVQADFRIIRRLPRIPRRIGVVTPLLIGGPVAVGALLWGLSIEGALSIAAIAMASSPNQLEHYVRGRAIDDRIGIRLLKLEMAFAGIPAVAVFAVAASIASPLTSARGGVVDVPEMVLVFLGVGVLVGYALVVLVRGVREHVQLLTLAIGGMCVVAGATAVMGVSALPAAACAGAVVVNRTVFPNRILRVAHSLERPMLVALLVLVGASWSGGAFSVRVFILLTAVRMVAALGAGRFLGLASPPTASGNKRGALGIGLLSQGELALGLLVAVITFFPVVEGVLEAAVAALVVNNVACGAWMRRRLSAENGEEPSP